MAIIVFIFVVCQIWLFYLSISIELNRWGNLDWLFTFLLIHVSKSIYQWMLSTLACEGVLKTICNCDYCGSVITQWQVLKRVKEQPNFFFAMKSITFVWVIESNTQWFWARWCDSCIAKIKNSVRYCCMFCYIQFFYFYFYKSCYTNSFICCFSFQEG